MAISSPAAPHGGRELTWEEYQALPETMERYEIIDGVMVMSPAPSEDHQWELSELNDIVRAYAKEHRLGVVLFAPLDIVIRKTPKLQTRQPDLVFFSYERIGGTGRRAFAAACKQGLAPDLAVELLSPDETKRTLKGKLRDYAEIGVREVWIISDQLETVEVLALREGAYARVGLYGTGDTLTSEVLPGFAQPVDRLFDEEEA